MSLWLPPNALSLNVARVANPPIGTCSRTGRVRVGHVDARDTPVARQRGDIVNERELIRRMQEQLLHLATKAGHISLVNDREHLGRCNMVLPKHGCCSPLCVEYRAVMDAASDYLEAHPVVAPLAAVQPAMFAEMEVAG